MSKSYIQIHPNDNVVVALTALPRGTQIEVGTSTVICKEDIPEGHKIAIKNLQPEEQIIKYGFAIGKATHSIAKGSWVNEKDVQTNLSGLETYIYHPVRYSNPYSFENRSFKGYRRKNGKVGIRNEIWIIPTVGCVNSVVQRLAEEMKEETGSNNFIAFTHNYGCSQLGEDHENTRIILRNMALHPNAGGVLIVGLGCENNQPDKFRLLLGDYDKERIRIMVCQNVSDEIEEGKKVLRDLYDQTLHDERTDIPLSELKVGLKCGGSDGFSGITANPLLGEFSDYLIAQGGTAVLTEVPEMFGAETILMNRCRNEQLFLKIVNMINDFKNYYLSHGEPIGENPSPGNKKGGISTLEEKSLGCTQKGGTSEVTDVLKYGECLKTAGLNLLSAPGNDLVASTALAASGCHLILFTTGRGTPFGTFVPTVKISTNTNLYQNKPHWIDFDAGILTKKPMDEVIQMFIQTIIDIINGHPAWNEKNEYHDFSIFKTGVTL